MRERFLPAALMAAALAPSISAAEPGGAAEVYAPGVEQGETEAELRGGILIGGDADGEWQTKAEVGRAFNGWWRPGLVAEWEHEGGATNFTALAVENIFDVSATRDWPVHFGGYLEYEWPQDGADHVEVKLLMQRERGPWDLLLNLIGEREVGSGASDEWEFGYAAQAAFAFNDDFALGIEGFGDAGTDTNFGQLGDQAHYWGPFGRFEIGRLGEGEVELQLGYLLGVGEAAADGQLRFKLEYEFGDRD